VTRYDEVIVGAPIYTTPSILEAGRVYIFENLQVRAYIN